MTVESVLQLIKSSLLPGSHPGLSRVRNFCELMCHPENKTKMIHIAGTNGKGSVGKMTALILSEAGYHTGFFSSPFLTSPMEYFLIDGVQINEARFCERISRWLDIALTMKEPPTEFEFFTVAVMQYFMEENCDIAIMECGMGGEKDATNVIPAPELCMITNIGMDHEAYLGNSMKEIAKEKAGIIKMGCVTAIYPSNQEVLTVLQNRCNEMNVIFRCANLNQLQCQNEYSNFNMDQKFVYQTISGKKYEITLPTPAEYQRNNCALVLEGISLLIDKGYRVTDKAVLNGLSYFHLPARFEIMSETPLIIADGGHNPQCMEALLASLRPMVKNKYVIVLTCVMRDKHYQGMYRILNEVADEYIAVSTGTERAMSKEDLQQELQMSGKSVRTAVTPAMGAQMAVQEINYPTSQENKKKGNVKKSKCLLITGSFYMMSEVRNTIKAMNNKFVL